MAAVLLMIYAKGIVPLILLVVVEIIVVVAEVLIFELN